MRMNEYHMAMNGAQYVMHYCSWCGGKLPESQRGTFFTLIEESEVQEMRTLLAGAKTVPEVLQILGEPDERLENAGGHGRPGKWTQYVQTLRYSSRWKSLVLSVCEHPDGNISLCWSGQYLGQTDS
ncbi:DUF6980 family protein [Planctomicrobium piriforme]|uniref:DUF6980 family protein n=1 Tax=Planctomicrobium piriforme TaxID=1576369 RepID=UPI0036F2ADD4